IDVFLLHCLLADSPPDTPAEIAALARNQHRTAASGREPGLMLERDGEQIALMDWAQELVDQCAPIAAAMDAANAGSLYADAVAAAKHSLQHPDTLPSARVLASVTNDYDKSFVGFIRAQSAKTREALLALPFTSDQQTRFEQMTTTSVAEQKEIEANDTMPFEIYRQQYVSAARLNV
ncbi:MAG TPA: glutamate--cysteine ligase, partial [Casimicrobium sp.]|nr:glutamate--cysteine ligase [Casimicrobium sp.]